MQLTIISMEMFTRGKLVFIHAAACVEQMPVRVPIPLLTNLKQIARAECLRCSAFIVSWILPRTCVPSAEELGDLLW
jgi:hypothetical protein